MKNDCSIVRDLLPLYIEGMVSPETSQYIDGHLKTCADCQRDLDDLKSSVELEKTEAKNTSESNGAKTFKRIMKRMNTQFYMLAYSLIIFFVFLGFSWSEDVTLMYNSLIMPIVGIFGYYVFGWKAVYKMPLLLLIIDMFVWIFKLVEFSFYDTLTWTVIYSLFVLVGIAIAFLLHFAFRKEK